MGFIAVIKCAVAVVRSLDA